MFITKRYTPPLFLREKWGHESRDQIENALERG